MNNLKRTNIPVWIAGCCLLVAGWGCSSEASLERLPMEGTPVEVQAEIAGMTETKTAVAENMYDRTSFVNADKIRIYRTGEAGITAQQADYVYNSGWKMVSTPVTLQAGATYQAVYPSDYERIQQDQSAVDGSGFLKSNLLKSGKVSTSDGVLKFVATGAFTHQHVKLTLEIKSVSGQTWNGAFSNTRLSATGLLTGGSSDESITLFQPDTNVRTWCGIAYPQNTTKTLTVQLTYRGVTYKTALSCGLVAGTHYKYTLTLQDNKLVPQGSTIEGWKSDPSKDYTGGFNNGTI